MEAFRTDPPRTADALDFEAFEAELHGSIVLPGSPDYDDARQVNHANADYRPALIVRAADAADVAQTVSLARESGLELSVRGGGHSLAGYGTNEGGIVLDLGAMKGLHIDPERRLAWAQPGLTRRGIHDRRRRPRPRDAVRRHGLGRHRRPDARWRDRLARPQVRPDHRCARRGRDRHRRRPPDHRQRGLAPGPVLGGPRRRRQLRRRHPLPVQALPGRRDPRRRAVHAGDPGCPAQPRADRRGRARGALDDLVPDAAPAGAVHPGRAGRPEVPRRSCSCGPAIRPQARRPSSRSATSRRRSSTWPCRCRTRASTRCSRSAEQRSLGVHRSHFLSTLDDAAVDAILEAMATPISPMTMIQLRVLGGAMARVPADETAFAHRDAAVMATDHHARTRTRRRSPINRGLDRWRFTRRSPRTASASTPTSSRPRATSGSARPTRPARTSAWPTSSAATTRPTCSACNQNIRPAARG